MVCVGLGRSPQFMRRVGARAISTANSLVVGHMPCDICAVEPAQVRRLFVGTKATTRGMFGGWCSVDTPDPQLHV